MNSLSEVDWDKWIPQQRATLLFVRHDGQLLLIHKKRGMGAGTINGPGGRIEDGETPMHAAIRETQEEICVTPLEIVESGELFFQFKDGLAMHVTVFQASGFEGEPAETDEAVPIWVPVTEIPYARMWEDDAYWLPLLLDNKIFRGYFIFDGTNMLDHRMET